MAKETICNKCNKEIKLGKPTGYRWFYDNNWEFYECGGQKLTPAEDWLNYKYTCGDCNTNKDEGIPYNYEEEK